jgi:hypothetical protein
MSAMGQSGGLGLERGAKWRPNAVSASDYPQVRLSLALHVLSPGGSLGVVCGDQCLGAEFAPSLDKQPI